MEGTLGAMRTGWLVGVLVAGAGLVGCKDLDSFRTDDGKVWRGQALGTERDGACAGEQPCSFIRRGFAPGTTMELTFDPDRAMSDPGTIGTDDDQCGEATFADTPLLPIAPLAHDPLSLYGFPGDDRLRNYLFVVRPAQGALEGREAMAFVSLVRGGKVEVRIIAGPGRNCAPDDCETFADGECDFFGVFRLDKEAVR